MAAKLAVLESKLGLLSTRDLSQLSYPFLGIILRGRFS